MKMLAHISEDGKREQTVKEHSENVANYACNEAKNIGLNNTMKIIGLLHDIGKNKLEFQNYLYTAVSNKDGKLKGTINHTSAGARYLYELIVKNHLYSDKYDKLLVELICYAIMTHHGLIDCIDTSANDKYTQKLYSPNEKNFNEVIDNINNYIDNELILELLNNAKEEIKVKYEIIKNITEQMIKDSFGKEYKNNPILFMLGNLQRLVNSFLIDADRRDTYEFMDNCKEKRFSEEELKILWIDYQNKLDKKINGFVIKNDIDKCRRKISDSCYEFAKCCKNGIYKLDVPTGGGKTLSSIRFALEFAKNNNISHIFYVAPYISILEQNAKEYRNIFNDDNNILEHHSNVVIDNENYEDILKNRELLEDNWSSPIILTTMVRFLEVLFDGSNSNIRRFHQLKNSVIILDEAQQIPVKCVYMFNTMINFLSNVCNSTIVLCSATQPLLGKVKHPLLYSENSEIVKEDSNIENVFKRNNIIYNRNTISGKYDKISLSRLVNEKVKDVSSILIILNTKKAVRDLYSEIKCNCNGDIDIIQLTTYMCPMHRLEVIEEIKERLAKEKYKKTVVISTQLIEAGVDISFEMVIRSLTGLDSIMQAAGRCNRNGERDISEVYMIEYQDENTNSLRDINKAKEATQEVLLNDEKFIEIIGEKIPKYYRQYFFNREGEMCYNISNCGNDNLYNLLSNNDKNNKEYIKESGNDVEYVLRQAYKTAGDNFKVIDNDTISLVVRYKDSYELVEEYKNNYSISEKKLTLKKLQRYTVSLFKNDNVLKELQERRAITYLDEENNILLLDADYYNENGITTDLEVICI